MPTPDTEHFHASGWTILVGTVMFSDWIIRFLSKFYFREEFQRRKAVFLDFRLLLYLRGADQPS
jgi:hypothetical protein